MYAQESAVQPYSFLLRQAKEYSQRVALTVQSVHRRCCGSVQIEGSVSKIENATPDGWGTDTYFCDPPDPHVLSLPISSARVSNKAPYPITHTRLIHLLRCTRRYVYRGCLPGRST